MKLIFNQINLNPTRIKTKTKKNINRETINTKDISTHNKKIKNIKDIKIIKFKIIIKTKQNKSNV